MNLYILLCIQMKFQQYKEQEKQRENDEIEKKKAEARRKVTWFVDICSLLPCFL